MTINKYKLSQRISERIQCTHVLASLFINTLSDIILEEIADGNSVMVGAIGKLSILEVKARKGVNPKTKESMMIPGKLRLKMSSYRACRAVLHRRFKDSK